MNARMEVEGQPSLHPSNTIWLGAGDKLLALWDTFTIEAQKGNEACDFSNFTEATEDCELCDWCMAAEQREQLCPTARARNPGSVKIASYDGFLTSEMASSVLEVHPLSGCSAAGVMPESFMPTGNATYQLSSIGTIGGVQQHYPFFEKKIFVVAASVPQQTSYELEYYLNDPANPDKVWYRWTVGKGPIWEDNFSEDLRVRAIRVLTGRKGTDPLTGRFRVEDARPVRPSRIVFLTNFNESQPRSISDILNHSEEASQRCYADPGALDAEIDLTRCRLVPGGATPSGNPPIYTANPNLYDAKQLTWFAEFNAAEGADFDPATPGFDPVPADALLAIEFTIENP